MSRKNKSSRVNRVNSIPREFRSVVKGMLKNHDSKEQFNMFSVTMKI